MADEVTYLELSEGSAHKFYEVAVRDAEVVVRFGRIGDAGQVQSKAHPSAEAARADAAKKVAEKKRKGYEPAVRGARRQGDPRFSRAGSCRAADRPVDLGRDGRVRAGAGNRRSRDA